MSFKTFFETGTSLKTLEEGQHTAVLTDVSFVENTQDESKSYVKLSLQLEDRVISDNRFEQGFNIFLSQIKRQLNIDDETMAVQDVLDLVRATPSINIWVSYTAPVNGRRYRNINYLPPLPTQSASEIAETTDLEECPL